MESRTGCPVDYTATRTSVGLQNGRLGDPGALASSCPAFSMEEQLAGESRGNVSIRSQLSSCEDEDI